MCQACSLVENSLFLSLLLYATNAIRYQKYRARAFPLSVTVGMSTACMCSSISIRTVLLPTSKWVLLPAVEPVVGSVVLNDASTEMKGREEIRSTDTEASESHRRQSAIDDNYGLWWGGKRQTEMQMWLCGNAAERLESASQPARRSCAPPVRSEHQTPGTEVLLRKNPSSPLA
jgi:hypothetical protein